MDVSVDPKKYDREYFRTVLNSTDYNKPIGLDSFNHIYRKVGNLIDLSERQHVVDFGCGSGHLSFYLFFKYRCFVTGIDYSDDAIIACRENLEKLLSGEGSNTIEKKVIFLQATIEKLPNLNNIEAVFLADVVEHLHDHELDSALNTFITWNNSKGISLVIHTDNNNFLRFVRPIIDALSIVCGRSSVQKIFERNAWERERHINLTTANKLSRKLRAKGFSIRKLEYPDVDEEMVRAQLGTFGGVKSIACVLRILARPLYFLRPSFYMVADFDLRH